MEKGKGSDFSERKLNRLLAQLSKTEEDLHKLLGDKFAQVLANHPSTIPPCHSATEHEQRSHALIENAPDLVSIMSADGTVIYEGPSSEYVLGYAPHEIQGKNVYDIVHRDDVVNIKNLLEAVLAAPGRAAPAFVLAGTSRWLLFPEHPGRLTRRIARLAAPVNFCAIASSPTSVA